MCDCGFAVMLVIGFTGCESGRPPVPARDSGTSTRQEAAPPAANAARSSGLPEVVVEAVRDPQSVSAHKRGDVGIGGAEGRVRIVRLRESSQKNPSGREAIDRAMLMIDRADSARLFMKPRHPLQDEEPRFPWVPQIVPD
jgi:hypothetical protein